MESVKYPRTAHLPWSLGTTSDDRILKGVAHFEGREVVITEKMDGENTTLYRDRMHARSLDSKGGADRDWVKGFWSSLKHEIPEGWRICGENLWARHSIAYGALESFFYGFSVWDEGNNALGWDDTLVVFETLGITPVPTLYRGQWDEGAVKKLSQGLDLGSQEGYVVRVADGFHYEQFGQSVAKFVRQGHVQTDKHWRHSTIVPNTLKQ